MIFFCYDILVFLFLVISSPYYLCRMLFGNKYRAGLAERLGRVSREKLSGLAGRRVCWIHAVSVGEVQAATLLVRWLKQQRPDVAIVLSTVTSTGQQLARKVAEADAVLYLPLDFGPFLARVLGPVRPEVFVIVETELWPRLLSLLQRQGASILLVNGRISDRSFHRYRRSRWLWKRVLAGMQRFAVQSEADADRIRQIGAPPERVEVSGNMKFDRVPTPPAPAEIEVLRKQFALASDNRLWVAGSTHAGEEELFVKIYGRLKARFPSLRLLLAPRHPERAVLVERLIREEGFPCLRRSAPTAQSEGEAVILLDTVGELPRMYALADYVCIGKSFVGWGGQNPLEAAALAKPIVFGPHMENFREAAKALLDKEGAVQVRDETELERVLLSWLQEPRQCETLGRQARLALKARQGATARNLELIMQYLDRGREKRAEAAEA